MPGEVIKDMAISMTTIGMADCSIETRKWEGAWEKWGEGGGGGGGGGGGSPTDEGINTMCTL